MWEHTLAVDLRMFSNDCFCGCLKLKQIKRGILNRAKIQARQRCSSLGCDKYIQTCVLGSFETVKPPQKSGQVTQSA